MRTMLIQVASLAVVLTACGTTPATRPDTQAPEQVIQVHESAAVHTIERADPQVRDGIPTREALRANLCRSDRPTCIVDRMSDASTTNDGAHLFVARVLPDGECEHPSVCAPKNPGPSTVPGWDPVTGRYEFDRQECGEDVDECAGMEFWLVVVRGEAIRARLVMPMLVLDPGEGEAGADTIEVGPNRFSHYNDEGSVERSSELRSTHLEPATQIEHGLGGEHMTFGQGFFASWDFERGSGFGYQWNNACGTHAPVERMVGVSIPVVTLASASEALSLEPGNCAASLRTPSQMPHMERREHSDLPILDDVVLPDANAPRVYLHGPEGDADFLVVEFQTSAASRVNLWFSSSPGNDRACTRVTAEKISVAASGPPHESVRGLDVDRVTRGERTRIQVDLGVRSSEYLPDQTFVAVDVGPFRSVAYAEGRPLLTTLFSERVQCVVNGQALNLIPPTPRSPTEPILGDIDE